MQETPEESVLRTIVEAIVSEPSAVLIQRSTDELGVLLELEVGKNDMGKILGREGQNINCIRKIIRVVGMKHGSRVNVKVIEPEGSEYVPKEKAMAN